MARFNPIEATQWGFVNAWGNREAIVAFSVSALLIKSVVLLAVLFLGLEDNYLRQGLVMLPAFFAEGALVAFVLYAVLGGHGFPDNMRDLPRKALHNLTASMIVYVLIKLLLAFIVGVSIDAMGGQAALFNVVSEGQAQEQASPPSAGVLLFTLALIGLSVWAFRFLWLYIPLALGQPVKSCLRAIGGFNSSLTMMACWLFCFLPFGFAMMIYMNLVLSMFPVAEGAEVGIFAKLLIVVGQGCIELAMIIVSSLAMGFGLRKMKETSG